MPSSQRNFYVGILYRDGEIIGHGLSLSPTSFTEGDLVTEGSKQEHTNKSDTSGQNKFEIVFKDFVSQMETYRRFMPLTLTLAPQIVRLMGERQVDNFVRSNGHPREDLSNADSKVYELEQKFLRDFWKRSEEVVAAIEGSRSLPSIIIVGLISAYDSFLASLLRVIFEQHEEIVMTSQKQITFKELLDFQSIDDARSALLEREIESVLRLSHHEQFDWMQNRFDIKLRSGLDAWPKFVELCERRNLFTHTGGLVSAQYLKTCSQHKCNVSGVSIGQQLVVGGAYFRSAVDTVYEIGLKLCYVFWRKFDQNSIDEADRAFNERCMGLISERSYPLAESLLKFAYRVPKIEDQTRRMMVVNLANAFRLQEKTEEANKLLDSEDWSATKDDFKISVAAVRGDLETVLNLMRRLGKNFDADNYRIRFAIVPYDLPNSSCPALCRASTPLQHIGKKRRGWLRKSALADFRKHQNAQVGNTRLPLTSPAMTNG